MVKLLQGKGNKHPCPDGLVQTTYLWARGTTRDRQGRMPVAIEIDGAPSGTGRELTVALAKLATVQDLTTLRLEVLQRLDVSPEAGRRQVFEAVVSKGGYLTLATLQDPDRRGNAWAWLLPVEDNGPIHQRK